MKFEPPRQLSAVAVLPAKLGGPQPYSAFRIRPETFRFTVVLGLLAALPSLSIDISQPTLLAVQANLASSSRTIGLIITVFMVGFALGQFGGGPLSDRHGRRPVLLAALAGFIIAGLGCAAANSALALIVCRFVQGTAAGACAVLAFTIIRDLFEGDAARSKRSYVIVVLGLAPLFAPAVGAELLQLVGWRAIYVLLALAGTALLLLVGFGVDESRSPSPVAHGLGASYRIILSNRRFLGLAVLNALSYGAIFAYIAGSPQMLMGWLELSGTGYGIFFACTAAALTAGAFVSGRCTKAGIGPRGLILVSLVLAAASAAALLVALATDLRSILVLMPLLLLNLFCRGITAPNAQHLALEPMRDQAGTAAAAVGVTQILTGALSSAIVALLLPVIGPSGMGLVMAILALAALLLWLGLMRAPSISRSGDATGAPRVQR